MLQHENNGGGLCLMYKHCLCDGFEPYLARIREMKVRRIVLQRNPAPRNLAAAWCHSADNAFPPPSRRWRPERPNGSNNRIPPPRTKWTRLVRQPVLIGHAASLTPYDRSGMAQLASSSRRRTRASSRPRAPRRVPGSLQTPALPNTPALSAV